MGYFERDLPFWLLNVVVWALVFYVVKRVDAHCRVLEWFGRKALLWYVGHFVVLAIYYLFIR